MVSLTPGPPGSIIPPAPLKLQHTPSPLEGLLKHRSPHPTAGVSDPVQLGKVQEFAMVTSSRVITL